MVYWTYSFDFGETDIELAAISSNSTYEGKLPMGTISVGIEGVTLLLVNCELTDSVGLV